MIAPPTDWDPTPAVANALLSTHGALAAPGRAVHARHGGGAAAVGHARPGKQVSGAELSEGYLDEVGTVESNVSLFKDLLYQPPARRVNQLTGR